MREEIKYKMHMNNVYSVHTVKQKVDYRVDVYRSCADCNVRCGADYCGGALANDVYYSPGLCIVYHG